MKKALGWAVIAVITVLTLFEGLLIAFAQFAHDFNDGGPNPPNLRHGWVFLALKVAALAISRRSGLPLLIIGIVDWSYGVVIFQMQTRHLPFMSALGDGWMQTSFLLLAVVYVVTNGPWQTKRSA
jgi:hypothetical protein